MRRVRLKAMMHIRFSTMPMKGYGAAIVLLLFSAYAAAQNTSSDTLQQLKDVIPQDQQNSILQGILGKGESGGTNKKTDNKLNMPETVQSQAAQQDMLDIANRVKTRDGRILRQPYEDPELRADDTVLIDLTPIEDIDCTNIGAKINAGNAGASGTN